MPEFDCYQLITGVDRPDLMERQTEISTPAWPEFMLHDPVSAGWPDLYHHFPEYQFALVDPDGAFAAVGNSLPLACEGDPAGLPDEGWDWAVSKGLSDAAARCERRVQCGIQIVVALAHRGKGISALAVRAMKSIGRSHGLGGLVVPARPTEKSRYPLVPMEKYIHWESGAGLPFDPWLRVHVRAGGRIVKVCSQSMHVTGSLADWERWTGMEFSTSGRYIVPGALVPVEIDREADLGTYIEPNVWVHQSQGIEAPSNPTERG